LRQRWNKEQTADTLAVTCWAARLLSLHGRNDLGSAVQVMCMDVINYLEWQVRNGIIIIIIIIIIIQLVDRTERKHRKWHARWQFLNGLIRLLFRSFVFSLKLRNSFFWCMTLLYTVSDFRRRLSGTPGTAH
jgi:hypothetical protein